MNIIIMILNNLIISVLFIWNHMYKLLIRVHRSQYSIAIQVEMTSTPNTTKTLSHENKVAGADTLTWLVWLSCNRNFSMDNTDMCPRIDLSYPDNALAHNHQPGVINMGPPGIHNTHPPNNSDMSLSGILDGNQYLAPIKNGKSIPCPVENHTAQYLDP